MKTIVFVTLHVVLLVALCNGFDSSNPLSFPDHDQNSEVRSRREISENGLDTMYRAQCTCSSGGIDCKLVNSKVDQKLSGLYEAQCICLNGGCIPATSDDIKYL